MREDTSTPRAFSPALIIGAVVAVIALSSIGVVIVQNMSNNGPVDVVVLKSETSSFKEKPAEEVSDNDAGSSSSVMNMLDDLTENKDDIEVLSLKTETPEMPEINCQSQRTKHLLLHKKQRIFRKLKKTMSMKL